MVFVNPIFHYIMYFNFYLTLIVGRVRSMFVFSDYMSESLSFIRKSTFEILM